VNEARFAPERFAMFLDERRVVDWLHTHVPSAPDRRVFAITDDPVFYILTGQSSIWMSNMYDASPVYRQKHVIKWLREETPPYTVLDRDRLTFDGFQKVVRVPLIFSEVASTYLPVDQVGRFQILRHREPGEAVALTFWRQTLGSDVNVGRLTSISSFSTARTCSQACGDLLEVELPRGGAGRVSLPMTISNVPFSLTFTRVPDETTYRLLLDRVWFWNIAKREGLPHAVDPTVSSDLRVRIRSVEDNPTLLY
jgi:hypothetical protein